MEGNENFNRFQYTKLVLMHLSSRLSKQDTEAEGIDLKQMKSDNPSDSTLDWGILYHPIYHIKNSEILFL